MEIRNTPPKREISARSNEELLDDLDTSLRDSTLVRTADAFAYVKEIHGEFTRRSVPLKNFIDDLSRKTLPPCWRRNIVANAGSHGLLGESLLRTVFALGRETQSNTIPVALDESINRDQS